MIRTGRCRAPSRPRSSTSSTRTYTARSRSSGCQGLKQPRPGCGGVCEPATRASSCSRSRGSRRCSSRPVPLRTRSSPERVLENKSGNASRPATEMSRLLPIVPVADGRLSVSLRRQAKLPPDAEDHDPAPTSSTPRRRALARVLSVWLLEAVFALLRARASPREGRAAKDPAWHRLRDRDRRPVCPYGAAVDRKYGRSLASELPRACPPCLVDHHSVSARSAGQRSCTACSPSSRRSPGRGRPWSPCGARSPSVLNQRRSSYGAAASSTCCSVQRQSTRCEPGGDPARRWPARPRHLRAEEAEPQEFDAGLVQAEGSVGACVATARRMTSARAGRQPGRRPDPLDGGGDRLAGRPRRRARSPTPSSAGQVHASPEEQLSAEPSPRPAARRSPIAFQSSCDSRTTSAPVGSRERGIPPRRGPRGPGCARRQVDRVGGNSQAREKLGRGATGGSRF